MRSILKLFYLLCYSLDSEFLVSTSFDGSARLWKLTDGTPLMNLDRSAVHLLFLFCYLFFGNGKGLIFVLVIEKAGGFNYIFVVCRCTLFSWY
jgi:WD40 repeat protein